MRVSDDHTIFAWTQRHAERQKMHGLLADLPADFASAANIVPRGDLQVSNPYSVTNSGLQITLPITREGRGLKGYVAFLDCVDENHRDKWVTLRLIRLSPRSVQYTRYDLNEIELRDTREKVASASKRIFVRFRVEESLKSEHTLNFKVSNRSGYN